MRGGTASFYMIKGGNIMAEECAGKSTCTEESCEGCPSNTGGEPQSMLEPANEYSCIRKVIGVVSGKGGVGKSMVTALLANALAADGKQVGIMDADITGPSIPRMYGIHGTATGSDIGIDPRLTENNIRVISMNLFLPSEDTPVIWRGPIIANFVKQFWNEVVWGDLDYLLVDMPPGTGDVPLTVFQSSPVDGIVVVTSPQDLVRLIVKKAVNMADEMKIPVLGLVENYSYMTCPDCGKKLYPFGESMVKKVAVEEGLVMLGQVPIDPAIAAAADAGEFHKVENKYVNTALLG